MSAMSDGHSAGANTGVGNQLATLVPKFGPAQDDLQTYQQRVSLVLAAWPRTRITELVMRPILNCKGSAFAKLQLHHSELLANEEKSAQHLIELLGGHWGKIGPGSNTKMQSELYSTPISWRMSQTIRTWQDLMCHGANCLPESWRSKSSMPSRCWGVPISLPETRRRWSWSQIIVWREIDSEKGWRGHSDLGSHLLPGNDRKQDREQNQGVQCLCPSEEEGEMAFQGPRRTSRRRFPGFSGRRRRGRYVSRRFRSCWNWTDTRGWWIGCGIQCICRGQEEVVWQGTKTEVFGRQIEEDNNSQRAKVPTRAKVPRKVKAHGPRDLAEAFKTGSWTQRAEAATARVTGRRNAPFDNPMRHRWVPLLLHHRILGQCQQQRWLRSRLMTCCL